MLIQIAVTLKQTTQIIVTVHVAYASTNEAKIISTETDLKNNKNLFYKGRMCLMFTCMFLHSAVINYVTEGALLISVHMFTENAPIVKMYFRHRAQEVCESRGGRPGLPVPNNPYGFCRRKATFEEAVYNS